MNSLTRPTRITLGINGAPTAAEHKAWDYIWLSPYTFCAADPINSSDPTGERIMAVAPDRDGNAVEYFWEERDGVWNFYDSGAYTDIIKWNPNGDQRVPTTEGERVSKEATLGHELAHIKYNWNGGKQEPWMVTNGKQINISEIYTTHIENQIRAEHNLPLRTFYKKIDGVRWDYRDQLINADGTSRFVNSKGVVSYSPLNKKSQPYKYIK